jgi:hypothetical protein
MHQACAMGAGGKCYLLGTEGVDRIKALVPTLDQDADQVDEHLGIARGSVHRGRMAQISLHGVDHAALNF